MSLNYEKLSPALEKELKQKFKNSNFPTPIRRNEKTDIATAIRPAYIRDVEKIIHSPFYNRYTDKTQVFSFYKNDDISRRAFHVQLVSRIARDIGRVLDLNLDLIEAIALGHDIGHTPFGHAGERILKKLYFEHTGRFFNHNVHSVRVLDKIFNLNLTLQTLDGVLCHNGELELKEYKPSVLNGFDEFDQKFEGCYEDEAVIKTLIPSTLEGCVVRVCDIIAYIGKDRQDAVKTNIIENESVFDDGVIGRHNANMINNLLVNIIENSYGKNHLQMDDEHFAALKESKASNSKMIYRNDEQDKKYDTIVAPMFERIYEKLLLDLKSGKKNSVIFKHHVEFVEEYNKYRNSYDYLSKNSYDDIVTDFIASMTDDYIIDLYKFLFNENSGAEYFSYFLDVE
ncbi:MAG: HD domain-containing protein [Clostridia bacterium]|nr:HD domain-containing protein [Clostridia bacterium]